MTGIKDHVTFRNKLLQLRNNQVEGKMGKDGLGGVEVMDVNNNVQGKNLNDVYNMLSEIKEVLIKREGIV